MKHSASCPDCTGALRNLPRNAGRGLIWIYRHSLSPLIGFHCRHVPTCSAYGDEAIRALRAVGRRLDDAARLLRCQPWGTSGITTCRPAAPPGARWYLPWRYARWRGVNDAPSP